MINAIDPFDAKRRASIDNPFATRFVMPSVSRFRFEDATTVDDLAQRLEKQGWWGQIVGPHGSGKTTLLGAVVARIADRGRLIQRYELHNGQRRLPDLERSARSWNDRTQVVVDGYEQLSRCSRWRLWRMLQRSGGGLLVTTHRDRSLPLLHRTDLSEVQAEGIVAALTAAMPIHLRPSAEQIRRLHRRHQGNMREILMDLYDGFEIARRQSSSRGRALE